MYEYRNYIIYYITNINLDKWIELNSFGRVSSLCLYSILTILENGQ